MSYNVLKEIEQSCRVVKQAAKAEVLLSYDVTGEVSYRIERYLCMEGGRLLLPATPCPMVGVQFSGKKVSGKASFSPTAQEAVSLPNVTLIIPGDCESVWEMHGVVDFAIIYFTGGAQQQLRHLLEDRHYPLALKDDLSGAVVRQLVAKLQHQEQGKVQQEYISALSNALFLMLQFSD